MSFNREYINRNGNICIMCMYILYVCMLFSFIRRNDAERETSVQFASMKLLSGPVCCSMGHNSRHSNYGTLKIEYIIHTYRRSNHNTRVGYTIVVLELVLCRGDTFRRDMGWWDQKGSEEIHRFSAPSSL